jgi:hypothetical protein
MIKLSNKNIMALLSFGVKDLISDACRPFPVKDAFRLAELLDLIEAKARVYREQIKSIIESHGGNIDNNGMVSYDSVDNRNTVEIKMGELDMVKVEIPWEPFESMGDWPRLTIQEALLLSPLVKKSE